MQSQDNFSFAYRWHVTVLALLSIAIGLGLALLTDKFFNILIVLLPYLVWANGLWRVIMAVKKRSWRKRYRGTFILGLLLISGAGLIFWQRQWSSTILWYLLTLYCFYSAYQIWRPVMARCVEKQIFWRTLGCLTAAGFAVFMLIKPRSEFSLALLLVGCFMIAWGIFQVLLPSPRE
jgi:uncharacterized membrane protein HdeD (DUF308 family)